MQVSTHGLDDLEWGDHLCHFCETEQERRDVAAAFLRAGIERGERVLCVCEPSSGEELLAALQQDGVPDRLEVVSPTEAYLPEGAFDLDASLSFLRETLDQAVADGHPGLRIVTDMSWVADEPPGWERVPKLPLRAAVELEGRPVVVLCQWERRRFDPELLLRLLVACPKVVVAATVCENPHHVSTGDQAVSSEARLSVYLDSLLARQQRAEERETTIDLLVLASRADSLTELLRGLTGYLQRWSGCEAVGVRLRAGDDFPYFETRSFSPAFVEAERSLCARDEAGRLVRDPAGQPVLECACGAVLAGRGDPSRSFFSERGSFWVGSTSELVATTSEAERPLRTHGRCLLEGYETMALVPLRFGGETIGLLQLNDRRRDRLDAAGVARIEDLADTVAMAIAHRQMEVVLGETEDQLHQAQKMEAIGVLAGGIAHDFNNLLTVVNGYAEVALSQPEGQPVSRALERILKAGKRAAELVGQLLAFSRRQVLEPTTLDLNEILGELEPMLARVIGEDIALTTDLAPDLQRIEADRARVEQVVMNLVANARDAMPQGGDLLLVTSDHEFVAGRRGSPIDLAAGPYVRLSVSDTGHGMDAEVGARVFEPFFTTKGLDRGSGLGLATVYGTVKQSGGDVGIRSTPGQGTTLEVFLPARGSGTSAQVALPATERPRRGRETILLAEDDEGVRELAELILTEHGYEVLPAASGQAAQEHLQAHDGPIELLLTDVVMPEMSGRELAERCRAARPDLRILFMSGYSDEAISLRGALTPGTPLLEKPFSPDRLARSVREVLDGEGAGR